MAKPRRRSAGTYNPFGSPDPYRQQRDTLVQPDPVATSLVDVLLQSPLKSPSVRSLSVLDIEDRRTFTFDADRPFSSSRRRQSPIKLKNASNKARRVPGYYMQRDVFAFKHPPSVAVCIRRKQRKQVLHALRKTGRGSGRSSRRWMRTSSIHC